MVSTISLMRRSSWVFPESPGGVAVAQTEVVIFSGRGCWAGLVVPGAAKFPTGMTRSATG
jgi:hypothetical protein